MKCRLYLLLGIYIFHYGAFAQVNDDFTDGDFTNSPVWSGDTSKFEVSIEGKLHLNAPVESSQAYLSIPSQAISEAEWAFYVEIDQNPSSTNYAKVYLTSDQENVSGSLQGYFVKVGGSTDEISLYRQDGIGETEIIDGLDGRVDVSLVKVWIKVNRDPYGNWSLQSRTDGEADFTMEGAVQDNMHTVSSFFGLYCKYTSTRSQAFYFDDLIVSGQRQPDITPPFLLNTLIQSETQLNIAFSEAMDTATVSDGSNYLLNNQNPSSATFNGTDTVALTFSFQFKSGETLLLSVKNLSDTAGNVMKDTILTLLYFKEVPATFRDIVINEILPDPNPQVDSLPSDTNAEFIELYNQSNAPFELSNWSINEKILPSFMLQAGDYLILCRAEFLHDYLSYGNAVALSSWPSLPNAGGSLVLKDKEGTLVDSMYYESSGVQGGYAIEQISPVQPCDNRLNYAVSVHPNAATPGVQNSVFDDTEDQQAPVLIQVEATKTDSLFLYFDESISTTGASISLNQQIQANNWQLLEEDDKVIVLWPNLSLTSGTENQLEISGIADCKGNLSGKQNTVFYFDQDPPYMMSLAWLDSASIQISFNEKINPPSALQAAYYTLLPDTLLPEKVSVQQDSASVRLDFNSAFSDMASYEITVAGIEDRFGNAIPIPLRYNFITENHIDTVVVISEHQLDVFFNKDPASATAENPEHYFVDGETGNPKAAIVNAQNTQGVHLIFEIPFAENKIQTLWMEHLKDDGYQPLNTPAYRFIYDTRAPGIRTIQVPDASHLLITFDEPISDQLAFLQIHIQPEMGTPVQTALQPDRKSILLTLDDSLQPLTQYTLSVSGVQDLSGNTITVARKKTFVFDQAPPKLVAWQFVTSYQLKLQFDEALESTSAADLQHYLVEQAGYPDSILVSQLNPGTVFLSYAQPLPEDTTELVVSNLSDLHGNVMTQAQSVPIHNRYPRIGAIDVLSLQTIQLRFSKPVDLALVKENDFLINQLSQPASIQPDKTDSSTRQSDSIILQLKEALQPFQVNELWINAVQDLQGNISDSLRGTFTYDPMVEHIEIKGSSGLEIRFNVPLNKSTAAVAENYEVSALGYPAAVVMSDDYTVHLLFKSDFENQLLYELHIKGFRHRENGFIPASHHQFGTGEEPAYHELLITEIMADPTPAVSLPEEEYIELHNPTEKIISLKHLRLSDGSSSAAFPASVIMPGEYLIVCAHAAYLPWSSISKTIAVSNFPSLNAGSDHLVLSNETGETIFSVDYSDEWYKDAEKKKGGWSLEMIDISRPCGEMDNWTASEDPSGGTPGRTNAVSQPNPDHFGPQILQAFVVSDSAIQVVLNEKLAENPLTQENFILSHQLTVTNVNLSESRKEVLLTLNDSLPAGEIITLTINHITDCSGNRISGDHHMITFGKPEKAKEGDILLSEILFNPRPGGVNFIELYNHADKFINLKDWSFARFEADTLKEAQPLTKENLVISPHQYLAFTEDKKILKADYPATKLENTVEVHDLPATTVISGNIGLLNPDDAVMQWFHYDEAYHHPLLEEKKGVSLERIDWQEPGNNPDLWQSAASLAGFATPGFRNSQQMAVPGNQASVSVDPKVFAPDQTGFADYTRIFYQFEQAGHVATIRIFDAAGRKVKDLVQNQTLAQEGFVVWNGTNNQQRTVAMGYYVILMEVYNPNGFTSVFKEKVVVGTRF